MGNSQRSTDFMTGKYLNSSVNLDNKIRQGQLKDSNCAYEVIELYCLPAYPNMGQVLGYKKKICMAYQLYQENM